MLEKSDHIIMLAVKDGNTEQLAQLFERHHLKLYNFLLKLCGNRQWSEDMVQESFIRILKYASSYRDDGCFLPWAFNIARNVAAQYLGKLGHERSKLSSDGAIDPDETEAFFSDPDYLQQMSEKKRKLQMAMSLIRFMNRSRLMRKLDGQSHYIMV